MSSTILSCQDVSINFGGVKAVQNVTLDIEQDSITSIIGPNGAGKTTFFNIISGVYKPTSGQVIFDGQDITNLKQHEVSQLGMARTFQNIRLFSELTVFENVLIAKHMRARQNIFSATFRLNHKEEQRMRREAMELLEIQNMGHLKDDIAGSLPYGIQRRLEIARALATDPKLLLLDEPTSNLDSLNEGIVLKALKEAQEGRTVILVSHRKSTLAVADRSYSVENGRLS